MIVFGLSIYLTMPLLDTLFKLKNISVTFEISLKGTNPEEFQILSGGLSSREYLSQIEALTRLIDYEKRQYPIFVRGILGIFHSQQYDLIFSDSQGRMMINPSPEFTNIVRELSIMPRPQERFYIEPLRFTNQMKGCETDCKNEGILTETQLGRNIVPGKKIPIAKSYLSNLLHI